MVNPPYVWVLAPTMQPWAFTKLLTELQSSNLEHEIADPKITFISKIS